MACGCDKNKQLEESQKSNRLNQLNQQKLRKLSLDDIRGKSIDDIVRLYQQGYRLDESYSSSYSSSSYSLSNNNTLQAWPIDLDCSSGEKTINEGSTLTAYWGYVYKVTAIDTTSREADIALLLDGAQVDSKIMRVGDTYPVANPANSAEKQSIVITNIFSGQEVRVVKCNFCKYTEQSAIITMVNVPPSYVDNTSYTVTGTGNKSISNSPLEKVVLTENGTKVTDTIPDTTGLFSLTFTYHNGKTYNVEYAGTIGVTYAFVLLKQGTETYATHQIRYIYPVKIPDAIFNAWQAIPDPIAMVGAWVLEHIPIPGWDIIDIRMYSDQIQIDIAETTPASPPSYAGQYNYLQYDPVTTMTFAQAIRAAIAAIVGVRMAKVVVIGLVAAIGIAAFIFLSRIEIMKLIGGIYQKILGKEAPKNKDVIGPVADPDDPNSLYSDMAKNCQKDYDACDKSTPEKAKACCVGDATIKGYLRCLDQAGVATIQGGLGAGFPKSLTALTAIADDLTKKVGNECIAKFNTGEMTCAQAVTCIQNLYRAAASPTGGPGGSPGSIYNEIYKNYYPNADWDGGKYGAPAGGTTGSLGKIILWGGIIVVGGYFVYKYVTKPKAAEIRVRTD